MYPGQTCKVGDACTCICVNVLQMDWKNFEVKEITSGVYLSWEFNKEYNILRSM